MMMDVFLTKASVRDIRKCNVSADALVKAVQRARKGLVDAQLGSTLIKQEIARPPEGRKTACRAIIAVKSGASRAVVMHVYAKSTKANLTIDETEQYAALSKTIVDLTEEQIGRLVRDRGWKRIG